MLIRLSFISVSIGETSKGFCKEMRYNQCLVLEGDWQQMDVPIEIVKKGQTTFTVPLKYCNSTKNILHLLEITEITKWSKTSW